MEIENLQNKKAGFCKKPVLSTEFLKYPHFLIVKHIQLLILFGHRIFTFPNFYFLQFLRSLIA